VSRALGVVLEHHELEHAGEPLNTAAFAPGPFLDEQAEGIRAAKGPEKVGRLDRQDDDLDADASRSCS
jgi:hypothetical protein